MKKVSAVDWLIDSYFGGIEDVTPNFRKFIEQAKEMEKENIIDAFKTGSDNGFDCRDGHADLILAEDYYKQTYEQQ
jgi:hypothetical protein